MDPHEAPGVELGLQLGQRLLFQQRPALRLKGHVVVLRLDIVDLPHRQHVNVGTVANDDPLERRARPTRGMPKGRRRDTHRRARTCSRQGFPQSFHRAGLEQVVDCMDIKRFQREFIKRRDEHHRHVTANDFEHLKPVELRHLHVENQQVGLELRRSLDRFEPIGALAHDLDATDRLKILPHGHPRGLLIVNDHNSKDSVRSHVSSPHCPIPLPHCLIAPFSQWAMSKTPDRPSPTVPRPAPRDHQTPRGADAARCPCRSRYRAARHPDRGDWKP